MIQKLSLLFLFTACIQMNSYTQNIGKEKLVEDFNAYIEYLTQTHPDPYSAYGGKMNFMRVVQESRAEIKDSTSQEQFRNILSSLITPLHDGHTIFYTDNRNISGADKFFPIVFKVATDGLFVGQTSEEYIPYRGHFLLSINEIPIDTILLKVQKVQPVENRYGALIGLRNRIANQKVASSLFGDRESLLVELKNTQGETCIITVAYEEKPNWVKENSIIDMDWKNNLLHMGFLPDVETTAYFGWNGILSREVFMGADLENNQVQNILKTVYQSMLKQKQPEKLDEAIEGIPELYSAFADLLQNMKYRNTKYLIIDLRENSGGMTPLCYPLLYMLYGDKYLEYNSHAEYNRLLSPLLLKKWNMNSINEYNEQNHTEYILGDYFFGELGKSSKATSLLEKRKELSLISYQNGIGQEYTADLEGNPIYEPHVIVLSSPKTFSAAYHFMYYLSEIGKATIVGVPSRQAGNSFMESTPFELSNTKIKGSISNSVQLMFPNDPKKGMVFMPDYPMYWKDYAKYNFDENTEVLFILDLIK
jgi:hypothetical protein